MYAKAVRILAKGYLPVSLITPLKLHEIIDSVKETLIKTSPDYGVVIKRLYLYYDMKLVTFGIDKERNLIIPCSNFHAALYTTTNTMPTRDSPSAHCRQNAKADTQLQIKKPYLALNTEMYINIWQQELVTCKRIN